MAQNQDSRSLQLEPAPELSRGKSQSFVMDISDWVLQLDNPGTPSKKSVTRDKDTPRTNGRDGSSSPLEKLPFNMIEVPTTTTMDSDDQSRNQSRSAKSKNARTAKKGSNNSKQRNRNSSQKKSEKTKRSWFRRGSKREV